MSKHAEIRIGRLWNVTFFPGFPMRIMACLTCLSLLGLCQIALPAAASAGVSIDVSVNIAPPALPVYTQPPCPGAGYIWTPGYWAWDPEIADYYWVPGTWVEAPYRGALWTPSYWGWDHGVYVFHRGYWGPEIGFYGGINYGYGYSGRGYEGGYWRGNNFFYNRTVNNINNVHVTNVYNKTVINNINVTHVSYNGGPGGAAFRPTPRELSAGRQRHFAPTVMQRQHEVTFKSDPRQRASMNHGRPSIAAMPKPNMRPGVPRPSDANHGTPHPGIGSGKNPTMAGDRNRSADPGKHPAVAGGRDRGVDPGKHPSTAGSRDRFVEPGKHPAVAGGRDRSVEPGKHPAMAGGRDRAADAAKRPSNAGGRDRLADPANRPANVGGRDRFTDSARYPANANSRERYARPAEMANRPVSPTGYNRTNAPSAARPVMPGNRPMQTENRAGGHPTAQPRPGMARPSGAPHAAPPQQQKQQKQQNVPNAPHREQHG